MEEKKLTDAEIAYIEFIKDLNELTLEKCKRLDIEPPPPGNQS